MIASVSKQAEIVQRRYPFLQNFPFSDFRIGPGDIYSQSEGSEETKRIEAPLVKFDYQTGKSEMTIVVFEKELNWIASVSDRITEIDEPARIINEALESNDILVKRDAINYTEKWFNKVNDGHTRLSYSTGGEILASLVRNHGHFVSIINKIIKLAGGRGLVFLTEEDYSIILTHYHFQLIYCKLILGIVIASKISI